ncbi:MAG: response regulator [Chloroflexi bacterium AL-W]|nr:response regulator [Chloroflexi bacterium AL-N1]NOK67594.1 response regulator [Chloroflexi bacterium AL-N10]NOK75636.1 response regulator [Chloroflexi bacterium AL-N5]NOK82424.1 response regulator [Chloroflexi bacterium AL-W]NOK90269.1 response regulator [Chloroflexi bacterium AL-N15]
MNNDMSSTPAHILIVEDEDDVRTFFVRAFERLIPDVQITAACSGTEALDAVQQYMYDLIISDHRMAGMTGTDLVKAIRTQSINVPIVMISADATIREQARQVGVNEFFHKPVTLIQLRQIIDRWLPL